MQTNWILLWLEKTKPSSSSTISTGSKPQATTKMYVCMSAATHQLTRLTDWLAAGQLMHLKRMKVVEKNKMTNKKENENGLCTLYSDCRRPWKKIWKRKLFDNEHTTSSSFQEPKYSFWRQSSTMIVTSSKVVIVIMIYAQRWDVRKAAEKPHQIPIVWRRMVRLVRRWVSWSHFLYPWFPVALF